MSARYDCGCCCYCCVAVAALKKLTCSEQGSRVTQDCCCRCCLTCSKRAPGQLKIRKNNSNSCQNTDIKWQLDIIGGVAVVVDVAAVVVVVVLLLLLYSRTSHAQKRLQGDSRLLFLGSLLDANWVSSSEDRSTRLLLSVIINYVQEHAPCVVFNMKSSVIKLYPSFKIVFHYILFDFVVMGGVLY